MALAKSKSRRNEKPHLQNMSPEDLSSILEEHRLWLDTDGVEGQRADLSGAIFVGVDLSGANLRRAIITGANLLRANLSDANIQDADLSSANLNEANCRGAILRGASLAGAKIQNALLGGDTDLRGARLCDANLEGTHLGKANLEDADLARANLRNAHFGGANLKRADLTAVDFQGAKLSQAVLWEADMQDADLTGARYLVGSQLAGANLSGAKLPEAIASFSGLHQVEVTAHIARPMFLLMLLGGLYSFATISATTDAALLANSAAALLPDVSVPIPTAGFYIAAPILLFFVYLYFHLYLEQLWHDIGNLPATFPDGSPLHRNVYPWLLLRLLARFVSGRGAMFWREISVLRASINVVFIFLVWWLVPFILLLFWGRFLPAHDWYGTGVHIALLVISIGAYGFGLHSYGLARAARAAELLPLPAGMVERRVDASACDLIFRGSTPVWTVLRLHLWHPHRPVRVFGSAHLGAKYLRPDRL